MDVFRYDFDVDEFFEDDFIASEGLLELKRRQPSVGWFSWGCKRKRTVPTPKVMTDVGIGIGFGVEIGTIVKRKRSVVMKGGKGKNMESFDSNNNGGSPLTPLNFNESDESECGGGVGGGGMKEESSSRKSYKRMNKRELTKKLEELSEVGSTLKRELQNVKVHLQKLKKENIWLKDLKGRQSAVSCSSQQSEVIPAVCLDLTINSQTSQSRSASNVPEPLQCRHVLPDLNLQVEQLEERIMFVPPPSQPVFAPIPFVQLPAPVHSQACFSDIYDSPSKTRKLRMEKMKEKRALQAGNLRR